MLSITDNPGGHAMLAPDALGTDLISRGQEVIIHLACKDWNRNALESRAWQLGSEGFHNVLALSGDYPVTGHKGLAAPVFDIDSVGLLSAARGPERGAAELAGPRERLDRTDFFLGCVVTNHKRHEREVMPQYFKLRKKAQAGARFVINQIGWDVRKDDELLRWIRRDGLPLHALANVYLLSRAAARAFRKGKIPGVVVTDELLELAERHGASPDNGPGLLRRARGQARRGRARPRLRRRLPRRPHAGCHLRRDPRRSRVASPATGASSLREIQSTRSRASSTSSSPTPRPGSRPSRVNEAYLESKRRRKTDLRVPLKYRFSRRLHDGRVRGGGAALPGRARVLPRRREGARPVGQARARGRAGGQGADVPLPGLRRLLAPGDRLRLPRVASVRRTSATGPCGGTRDGLCEVYDSECIWSQAYERLKAYGEEESMLDGPVVIKDNALVEDERVGEHVPRPRPHRRPNPRRSRRERPVEPGDRPGGDAPPGHGARGASSGSSRRSSSLYGPYKAKIDLSVLDRLQERDRREADLRDGDHADEGGEGKTTTSVSLTQGLGQIGKRPVLCLREASLGPVFGIKGGACGGGYAQVVPMEDLNLHFTGDIHAIGAANNLLAAIVEAHVLQGNPLGIDPLSITWRRCVDINDRALREIVVGLGGRANGVRPPDGLRHHRRVRGDGDRRRLARPRRPAATARRDHRRAARSRASRSTAEQLRAAGVDDGRPQGRAQAEPRPDARGPACACPLRPLRQHRARQQLADRRPRRA